MAAMFPALVFLGVLPALHAQGGDFMTRVEIQPSRKEVAPGAAFSVTCFVTMAEKFADRKKREARPVLATVRTSYGLTVGDAQPSSLTLDSIVIRGGLHSKAASVSFSREGKPVSKRVRRQSQRQSQRKLLNVVLYQFPTPDSTEAVAVASYDAVKKVGQGLVSRDPPLLVTGKEDYSEISSWGVVTTNMTVTFRGARCADSGTFQCSGEILLRDVVNFATDNGVPVNVASCRRCGKGWC